MPTNEYLPLLSVVLLYERPLPERVTFTPLNPALLLVTDPDTVNIAEVAGVVEFKLINAPFEPFPPPQLHMTISIKQISILEMKRE